ncbi:unnamed protein product [Euphydryas editha]|uniref:Uncharacterized protein n=1 Tax=Euphydryas editha TaxID=104508 RepID=A0AAU9UBS7_EUPED|nr:unnamed protein product [Euphydryas editha]
MGHIVYNETIGIVEDLGDLLNSKNNQKKEGNNDKNVNHEKVSNSITASAIIQESTAKNIVKTIQPNEPNAQDLNTYPATETAIKRVKEGYDNDNQEESTKISESSESSKLVFTEEDHHYGEGIISPRIARHIKMDNIANESLARRETPNTNTFNELIVMYENSIVTNFENLTDDMITDISFENKGVEVVIMKDCPEEQEMTLDGSCKETDVSTENNLEKGIGRANFEAGCFNGFARADDGSCQEVLYD